MIIKSEKEHILWQQYQQQVAQITTHLPTGNQSRPEVYEQILVRLGQVNLTEEFYHEDIELNLSIFNSIVSLLVINQLHKSSSILLCIVRFYENVSTIRNPSVLYLRLIQASLSGYLSSSLFTNVEYQQRWSAFVHFQLPRLLASCFETNFDHVTQAFETLLVYNEYLLNSLDELCLENVTEQIFQRTLKYIDQNIQNENQSKIIQLTTLIKQMRSNFREQIQNNQTNSNIYQILQMQRSLEESLQLFLTSKFNDENLQHFLKQLQNYLPIICALDQYYSVIDLLLANAENDFVSILYSLCYITMIADDLSEDFGHLNLFRSQSSSTNMIYVWLKKYWLSRSSGHALFGSPLNSIDFVSSLSNSFQERISLEKDEFLEEIQRFQLEPIQMKYSHSEYLTKTVLLLGELQSLSLTQTKQIVQDLINYLTHVSPSSLVHLLLWLIANYQIASDDDRPWIQNTIYIMTNSTDSNSIQFSPFDQIKRQLWSEFIDNPLSSFYSQICPTSPTTMIGHYLSSYSSSNPTILIEKLFEIFERNEFIDSNQSRAFYICSKYCPIDLTMIRIFDRINSSNGIHETNRTLFFLFGFILFRRRSSTRCLFERVFPYLFNMKSNEFMLEPNVSTTCLILIILLILELDPNNEQFPVKPWREFSIKEKRVEITYENFTVIEVYKKFFDYSCDELFSSEIVRPVNYLVGYLQTLIWMFSRTVNILKPFLKAKLITQLAEYLPLQYPIEKVLSILDLSTQIELEYASMIITRDFSQLRTASSRTTLKQNFSFNLDEPWTKFVNTNCSTKHIHFVSDNL